MKKLFLLSMLLLSFCVSALELSDAKQQGLVGEQTNGLLGVVKASQPVIELVQDINARRLIEYKQIAKKNAMTLEQVEMLAGKKTISKTPRGQYIQNSAGQWVVK